ncbi:hypothetical protein [Rosenbergiella epipactidis]|uniref:hypothetical protein n=1 Tax=Rosenbergiella epipactidis TaxID=1544694 RepID=UPI001F502866|nr:hypothetical protein [Rosenbergiella epipactidis]
MNYQEMSDSQIMDLAINKGISFSVNRNFMTFGDCVAATYPTHGGKGCDSAIAILSEYKNVRAATNAAAREAINLMMKGGE